MQRIFKGGDFQNLQQIKT